MIKSSQTNIFNTAINIVNKKDQKDPSNTLYLYADTINNITYLKFGEAFKSTVWDRYNATGCTQHNKIIKVWKSSVHDKPIHRILKQLFDWAGPKETNPLNTNEAYIVNSIDEVHSFINTITDIVSKTQVGPDFFRQRFGEKSLIPRNYQKTIIEQSKDILNRGNRLLINLSTRAGKSFISLKICKDLKANNILILTPFPSAEDSFEKLGNYNLEFKGYKYIHLSSKTTSQEFCKKNIIFCSYQFYDNDKDIIKVLKDSVQFDFVILDECHHTSDSERTTNTILKNINYNKLIYMSGTPFNDIYSGYFNKDEIITFDFIDFIKYARVNPNEITLPKLNIKNVCNLSDLQNYLVKLEPTVFNQADAFDYSVIFSDSQHAESFFKWLLQPVESSSLIISKKRWFDLSKQKRVLAFFSTNSQVSIAKEALKKMLPNWSIESVSGEDADIKYSDEKTINNKFERDNTIVLTCGKLTTGVTLPKLDTIWYFKSGSSAEQFIQILFRMMTPYKCKDEVSMYCFDTEASLKVIKEYATIRLDETSTNVSKDLSNDTFKSVIEEILSCINFTYLNDDMKFVEEDADKYFEKLHKLPYNFSATYAFKNFHSFDGIRDLGTELLTEKDLIVSKAQDVAVRNKCERNNKLKDIIAQLKKNRGDNKCTDISHERVVRQLLKILVNIDKKIIVNNINTYSDLSILWPNDSRLSMYKDNYIRLLEDNKVRLNQVIEDIRYKLEHCPQTLLNGLSFSNNTDMKTPDSLLHKMFSKLSNTRGIICDPCCGIGTIFEYAHNSYDIPKDNFYGIELEHDNVKLCHLFGYNNVIQGDATDPKSWDKLIELLQRNTNKMKFDHIIMNPPYCRNLHLKILNEAIKHSNDVVNLSPIRWLQDPLAEHKRNSDFKKFKNIIDKIDSIHVIYSANAQRMFNAGMWMDLGIYHLSNNGGFDSKTLWKHAWFVNKVITNIKDSISDHLTQTGVCNFQTPYIKVSELHGHQGNKDFYDFVSPSIEVAKSTKVSCGHHTANFATEEESINFFNSLCTKFYRFINKCIKFDMNVPWEYAPWMSDYTHPWNDKDLYEYFNLTPEETAIIESEI